VQVVQPPSLWSPRSLRVRRSTPRSSAQSNSTAPSMLVQ
jgi:hypothetical protein